MYRKLRKGFTLIELLVVIGIIGILAAVILVNMANAAKRGRDAERQSDLRNLQNAIEAYKHRNGMYPAAGCGKAAGEWAHESDCAAYITGLAPNFIPTLPHDGARGVHEGYSYITNEVDPLMTPQVGMIYKVMAMNTVEADKILYDHPFKSCDIRYGGSTIFTDAPARIYVNQYGWCSVLGKNNSDLGDTDLAPRICFSSNDSNDYGIGTGRFDNSYGLWGGYGLNTATSSTMADVFPTAQTICK